MEYRVLVVDDIEKNLQLIGNLLQGKGINIMLADSGKKALAATERKLPDLILLDIAMPEMDGYEVCSILKKDPETSKIPIIFLTARNETEDIVKGFAYGAVDYVTKPFNKNELMSRVFTHLELKKSRDIIGSQNQELEVQNAKILEHSKRVEELNEMLNTQNMQLKESNSTKDKLFSIISHDLRAPIGTFMSSIELLTEDDSIDEELKNGLLKELGSISKSTYNLLDNLLAWSRSQLGIINIEPNMVQLHGVINEILELFQHPAKVKSIESVNLTSADSEVFVDVNLLKLFLRNLVSNALKFSNQGGRIEVSAEKTDEVIKISVKDNGVGMDEETRKGILEPNVFKTTYGTSNEKGAGLGLKLVNEFVEKSGGKMWIESEQGKGSVFHFTLPAGPA